MPQTSPQRNQKSAARPERAPKPPVKASPAPIEDQIYAVVSVLYHALQGVQACEQYIDDAESAGDDELVRFFEECRDQQTERATRARQLLVDRAEEDQGDDADDDERDSEDDEDDES